MPSSDLHTLDFWRDAHYTHVSVLEAVAATSPRYATRTLTNPNLIGATYRSILTTADLTTEGILHAGPAALVHQRANDEVHDLILATVARSDIAVTHLLDVAAPAVLLGLWHRATASRFKGAATLRRAIASQFYRWEYATRSHLPGYRDLADDLAAFWTHIDGHPSLHTLTSQAAGRRTHAELAELAPVLARVRHIPVDDHEIDGLLLATWDHPDVVAVWAEHGGDLGLLLAAGDDRQDPQLLGQLCERISPDLREACVLRLAANPACDRETLVRSLATSAAIILTEADTDDAEERLRQWHEAANAFIDASQNPPPAGPVSTWHDYDAVTAAAAGPSPFLAARAAVSAVSDDRVIARALSTLADRNVPGRVAQDIAARISEPDDVPTRAHRLLQDWAQVVDIPTTHADAPVMTERHARSVLAFNFSRVSYPSPPHAPYCPSAPYLNEHITTPAQALAFARAASNARTTASVHDAVQAAHREAPPTAPGAASSASSARSAATTARYGGLLGNALGAL